MSKKDYQKLAGALHRATPGFHNRAEHREIKTERDTLKTWDAIVAEIAAVLAADNPRFDRERFILACETGKGAK